jgi:dCTP deaminase
VPLIEELRLPQEVRAKANPKSSTGRLDVFTRVLTDRNHRFDEIAEGYRGKLYLEVVPRTFAIRVKTGLALNQVRLMSGDARLDDEALLALHARSPLLYREGEPVAGSDLSLGDGLFLSLDVSDSAESIVGYRAKKNSLPIDLTRVGSLRWREYWEPVHPERGGRIVLEPEVFYLLLSAEGVSIPPSYAAEMLAYDPTAGELRTHYAGFFDPGFGFHRDGSAPGSRAALEVRARDVSFMVEHGQPVCKLAFERMSEEPDVLYGKDIGSNYQGQLTMLSKHFLEQRPQDAPPI